MRVVQVLVMNFQQLSQSNNRRQQHQLQRQFQNIPNPFWGCNSQYEAPTQTHIQTVGQPVYGMGLGRPQWDSQITLTGCQTNPFSCQGGHMQPPVFGTQTPYLNSVHQAVATLGSIGAIGISQSGTNGKICYVTRTINGAGAVENDVQRYQQPVQKTQNT